MLMLAGVKTQWSFCVTRDDSAIEREYGFQAAQLRRVLEKLPLRLWDDERRVPGFIEQVLERARQEEGAPLDGKPWVRTTRGFYLPNPNAQLLRDGEWRALYDAIPLDWIERGTGGRFSPGQDVVRGISMLLAKKRGASPSS